MPAILHRHNASVLLPTLRVGDRNYSVILLQQGLYLLGYYAHPVDGVFGLYTQAAVAQFQAEQGLCANGVVDSLSWERLAIAMEWVD